MFHMHPQIDFLCCCPVLCHCEEKVPEIISFNSEIQTETHGSACTVHLCLAPLHVMRQNIMIETLSKGTCSLHSHQKTVNGIGNSRDYSISFKGMHPVTNFFGCQAKWLKGFVICQLHQEPNLQHMGRCGGNIQDPNYNASST